MKTVSEWLQAGGTEAGLYLVSGLPTETAAAIGFARYQEDGNGIRKPAVCWFPKSRVEEVRDDVCLGEDRSKRFFLVPSWLYAAKQADGFDI